MSPLSVLIQSVRSNYFEHYLIYFTRFTDLTGYDGGFTLGHFWFIAVLIIISCLACGVIKLIDGISRNNRKIMLTINCFIIIVAIAVFDVAFWGKRIPAYLCVYLLGYYLFSSQEFIKKLVKVKIVFVFVFVLSSMMNAILFVYIEDYALLNNICNYLSYITGISALICLAKEYLDYSNKVSRYCARLSYVFYIVHFPIVVLCQYFISLTGVGSVYNFVLSLLISTILTCSVCCMIEKNTVGILFLNSFNEAVIGKILKSHDLEFHELFIAKPHVFISRKHPLSGKTVITNEELEPYPYLSFEQGEHNSFYFSEEIFSPSERKKNIRVRDRATLFNLLIGLNGYTVCSGVIDRKLNGNGDYSSRSMELNCKKDINFMFLLEGIPASDHATFVRFRSIHFAPCSKRILAEMSNTLYDLGEISGENHFY